MSPALRHGVMVGLTTVWNRNMDLVRPTTPPPGEHRHADRYAHHVVRASTPVDGALRVVRAGLLAVTSAALTVAAHGIAGGGLPNPGLTVLCTLLVAGAGMAVADRRRHWVSILGVLSASQLAAHALLTTTSAEAAHGPAMGHAMAGPVAMTVGHGLATLVLAVVLARADALLVAAASGLDRLLPRRLAPLPASPPARVLVTSVEVSTTEVMVLLRRIRTRRGPPHDS